MTFVTFINVIMMLLCVAVIFQTLRMAKGIRDLRSASLADSVTQLERATGQAKAVLTELKTVLATEVVAQGRAVAASEALRDELSVMVGVGNAVAERIMEAAAMQNEAKATEAPKNEIQGRRQGARKNRSRTASGRRKPATPNTLADTPVAGHA
jgi:hypothetical protein